MAVEQKFEAAPQNILPIGLPLGCDSCVLPHGYAGAKFLLSDKGELQCNFCSNHVEQKFLGEDQLISDLDLNIGEKVGVTVSGGKDSLYMWRWLTERLGKDSVVAFNHNKVGLNHPIAEDNLKRAQERLKTELVYVEDCEMLPRFQRNIEALLNKPDAAMVRVALCAGCRYGISGRLFKEGEKREITKFFSAASYLELAPFKGALMQRKGNGNEKEGLLIGLQENPLYYHDDNINTIMLEDEHCHKKQLSGGGSYKLYPNIRFFDFDQYIPNIPARNETVVREKLNWDRPKRSWHFDCLIEPFKDFFYYGLLGYTETDYYLSAMIRYGLINRSEAIKQLFEARHDVINGVNDLLNLARKLGIAHLVPELIQFARQSSFLSEIT